MNNYFIKNDYQINPVNKSIETADQDIFWNERNIRISRLSQFYVYQMAKQIAVEKGLSSILDIGCGVATQLNAFFGDGKFQIFGVDQPHAIEICKKIHKGGTYTSDNFENPSYSLRSHLDKASLIICADVIEHLENPDHLLNYIKKFSDNNTYIVISTPERDAKHGRTAYKPKNPYHIREWNREEFTKYLSFSGFEIITHTTVHAKRLIWGWPHFKLVITKAIRLLPLKDTQVVVTR